MLLLVAAAGAALVDWWSVFTDRPRVETLAKPAVMVLLLTAVVVEASGATPWVIALALLLSLIGDVLLLPAIDRFVLGLAAFLVAHLAFIIAFSISLAGQPAIDALAPALGVGLALALWWTLGRRITTSSRTIDPTMGSAVSAYILALTLMVVAGVGVGSVVLASGTLLFALSDSVLGWNRFVGAVPHGRLATHVLYHSGQGLIAWWAINTT